MPSGEVCYQLLLAKDLKVYKEARSDYDRAFQMLSQLTQSLSR
jgi:hypothetical protein